MIFVALHSPPDILSSPYRKVWLAIPRDTVTKPDVPGPVHEVVVAVIPGAFERPCLTLWLVIGTGSRLVDLGPPPSPSRRTTPPTTPPCPLRFAFTACLLASAEVGGPFVDTSNSSDSAKMQHPRNSRTVDGACRLSPRESRQDWPRASTLGAWTALRTNSKPRQTRLWTNRPVPFPSSM